MGDTAILAAGYAGPVDVVQRLGRLEAGGIARQVASAARPLGKWLSDTQARIENRIIAHFLLRAVRQSIAEATDYAAAARRLARYREATARGTFGIFSPMTVEPPSAQGGWPASAEIAHWEGTAQEPDSEPDEPIMLYVPGGGFILPPSPAQVALAFRLAEKCGCEAVIGRHRLAPEYPFPAPIHDLADRYAALIAKGTPPSQILLAGDSAGGTLVLSMLLELRARKLPMPAGAMLFSPWGDLAMRGWSYISKSLSNDSPFRMETAAFSARLYLGDALPTDPRASPVYADLAGLPPLAIHCSRYDMHFDDAVTIAERAELAGVPVRVNYWDSPRHHLERFRSKDAEASFALAAEFAQGLLERRL